MKLPVSEIVKSIPGLVGIRLEEEPKFRLLIKDRDFELRQYDQMILAQTTVAGNRDEAIDEGFQRLATYIFGGNTKRETLSMTTPVLQSQTLSMTTPVLQAQSSAGWAIAFVLPSDLTLQTAPVPNDSRIEVVEQRAMKRATFRYSGTNTMQAMSDAESELKTWIASKALKARGAVQWAQYDQPFSLPFTKRNEAHVEIE